MSEEQVNQENQVEEKKVEKSCKSTLAIVLSIISLLLSLIAVGFSTYTFVSGSTPGEGKKVVISKQYDKGQSMDKAIATKKPIIAFFYTDWCGFCQRFVPTFFKITKDPQIKKNFAIAYVNCEQEQNRKYVEEYDVKGFPTVYVITPNGKKVHLDNNTFFNDDSKEVVRDNALKVLEEDN